MRWQRLIPGSWEKTKQTTRSCSKTKANICGVNKKCNTLCHKTGNMRVIYVCLLPLPQINFSFPLWIYRHPLAGSALMNEWKAFLHIILETIEFVS